MQLDNKPSKEKIIWVVFEYGMIDYFPDCDQLWYDCPTELKLFENREKAEKYFKERVLFLVEENNLRDDYILGNKSDTELFINEDEEDIDEGRGAYIFYEEIEDYHCWKVVCKDDEFEKTLYPGIKMDGLKVE